MKPYYECHVTMIGDKDFLKTVVEKNKWKFSSIDGDPTLGEGIKCYATMHYSTKFSQAQVLKKLMTIADNLQDSGAKIIRTKIELVIYDLIRKE